MLNNYVEFLKSGHTLFTDRHIHIIMKLAALPFMITSIFICTVAANKKLTFRFYFYDRKTVINENGTVAERYR